MAAAADGLISLAGTNQGSFLAVEGIRTINQFKAYIETKRGEFTKKDSRLKSKSTSYIGAICLQSYIKDILFQHMTSQNKRGIGNNDILRERLAYFTSDRFIYRFMES